MLEIIEIIITIIAAGFILMPLVKGKPKQSFLLAGLSIVLHELGHKFVAIAGGLQAVYHANYQGLGLGLVLRFIGAPVFFVPAYVSISGNASALVYVLTALAGPLTNLAIFGITTLLLKKFNNVNWVQANADFINSLRVINWWLAIINLLPIPGMDGFNALNSLRYL
ncbi:MAG: hypothetical protein WC307_00715 [Candidatus Nanoarchaeia archaeon]|jgi:Zn-dependent protease